MVLGLAYGSICDARKWLARRRKNEGRSAERRAAGILLRTEKKRTIGGSRIDDLEGTKG